MVRWQPSYSCKKWLIITLAITNSITNITYSVFESLAVNNYNEIDLGKVSSELEKSKVVFNLLS